MKKNLKLSLILILLMSSSAFARNNQHICGSEFDATFAQFTLENINESDLTRQEKQKTIRQSRLQLEARQLRDEVEVLEARYQSETDPEKRDDMYAEISALNAQITVNCFRIVELN